MASMTEPVSMTRGDKKLHIVMFPWLAFGHFTPFLELSKLIAQKGHRVTFVSTPRNIDRLPKLPPRLSPLITLLKIPLPHMEKLPEHGEATIDLRSDQVKYLKVAYDQLQQPMTRLLQETSPDCVIYDFAPYWLGPIAAELGISSVFFSIFVAATVCFMGPVPILKGRSESDYRTKPEDFTVPPKWIPFQSSVAFRLFEVKRLFADISTADPENIPPAYRFGSAIEGSDVLAVRSCYEFEPEWLKLLEEIHQKPVIPVGQLPTTAYNGSDDDGGGGDEAWREIKEWLDQQSKGSVVYVAFGSESQPSQSEITEIALGLELSELPFFWVLRKRRGSPNTEAAEAQLPDGFMERTKGRGVVCTSWAPQLKILSHDSVGGFLSHSGWSSVVESIQFGKPLILLTFLADTGLTARLLEEKNMAYSIPRDEQDGSFSCDSVAESLKLVMVEEEGKIYRDKVSEMSGVFGDRDIQDKYVNSLLDYLNSHRKQQINLVKDGK